MKKKTYDKGGKVNMCNAIAEWIKEEKDAGYSEGKNVGFNEGKNAERVANIRILVRTCMNFNIPREQIREQIISQYDLTAVEAEKYLDEAD